MKPYDMPILPTTASPAVLEALALAIARNERTLKDLGDNMARQGESLAQLRKLLCKTMWPPAATTEKETP